MKKNNFKKVMFSVSTFLFAACLGFGAATLDAPVRAETLTEKNDFSGLDTSLSTGDIDSLTIGEVADNYIVVNKQLGGNNGINVDIEMDVTFTQNATTFVVGMLPTNNKDDIVASKKEVQAFPGADYDYYYLNDSTYTVAQFYNNGWDGETASSVQSPLIGQVKLKLGIGAWSNHSLYLYVPESNTQMDESVVRGEWIELFSEGKGLFKDYRNTVPDEEPATGYAFFSMQNVVYNNISIIPGEHSANSPSLNDDFSDASTFATNYVTNDAFDNAVADGRIILPKDSIVIGDQTTTDITTNHNAANDMFRSVQSFSGAMHLEMSMNSVGPTAYLGFYSLTQSNNLYVRMGLEGMRVYKYGEVVYNEFENEAKWATLLKEAGAGAMGGEFKMILDINAQGDTTISLQVINQTYGTALTKSLYEIATIDGLCADVVTGGGYLMFSATNSAWNNPTVIQDIKLTDAKGSVLIEDDFSCNNINENGARLWLLSDATGLYTLPAVNAINLNNGTVYVNTQNTATEKEELVVEWNAQVVGEMRYYFGMSEKNIETATAYAMIKDGALTFTQGENTFVLADGVDFTQNILVKLVFDNVRNKVCAYINNAQANVNNIVVDLAGYIGISATNANLIYLTVSIEEADSIVQMQAGAYVKANTTLKDSGIRFASVIEKAWYDEMKADASVMDITYGTLIVPTDYLSDISAFTLEGLETSGKEYINAAMNEGFTNEATAEADGYYQFMGGIKNILPANYTRNFSAVGYVTVTYVSGEVETYYTTYCQEDHSRNIYQLAGRMYADRSAEQTAQYTYQLNDGTWAKYSQEVMDVMYAYLDGVVNVTIAEDGTIANVAVNEYYQASYQVTCVDNVVTVESDTEVKTILVNGVRQKNFTTGTNGEKYTATFTL